MSNDFVDQLVLRHQTNIARVFAELGIAPSAPPEPAPPSHATTIVRLVVDSGAQLFRDPAGRAEISFTVVTPAGQHRETHLLRSRPARNWIARAYHEHAGAVPTAQSLQDALNVLEGLARHDGDQLDIHLRVAELAGAIYIDLGDDQWRAIEIDALGWRVIPDPPVRFRRSPELLPLPLPSGATGDLRYFAVNDSSSSPVACGLKPETAPEPCSWPHLLRSFLNIADDYWPLVLGWLVAALRPRGPYPVLCLHGEQGSAKSTTALVLRSLVDPNAAPLRGEPREVRDLMIAATHAHVICLDNLSRLPDWLSNCLCRLSTGGGFATRTLYENDVETVFAASRPSMLVGIDELATRGDLLDRALIVPLSPIEPARRRAEEQLLADFEQVRPLVFGGLCTALSTALKNLPTTRLERLPRMADFALWATAAEPALGLAPGAFIQAYEANRQAASALTLEANPLASALLSYFAEHDCFDGTATHVLRMLDEWTPAWDRRDGSWPRSARALSSQLRKMSPALRALGVSVTFSRMSGDSRTRTITLTRVPV